jgi:hypothetical protein
MRARFAGATMLFDAVPRWFSGRTMKGMRSSTGHEPPPMPWGVDAAERDRLAKLPGVAELRELRELRLPRGRGVVDVQERPDAGAGADDRQAALTDQLGHLAVVGGGSPRSIEARVTQDEALDPVGAQPPLEVAERVQRLSLRRRGDGSKESSLVLAIPPARA